MDMLSAYRVLVKQRTVQSIWSIQYKNTLIKYFDAYRLCGADGDWNLKFTQDQPIVKFPQSHVVEFLNQAVVSNLAGGEDGAWLKDAQLVVIFGILGFGGMWNKTDGLFDKEDSYKSMKFMWDGGPPGMTFVSTDIIGCKPMETDFQPFNNVPCLSGIIIPRIDGLQFKPFAVSDVNVNRIKNLKQMIGLTAENENILKGIVLIHKSRMNQINTPFVNVLYDYLKSKPQVVLAGGNVPFVFSTGVNDDGVGFYGFLIFGDEVRVKVGCKIINSKQNSTLVRKQIRELKDDMIESRALNEAIHSVAFVFAPEKKFNESKWFTTNFPDTQLFGCTTGVQFGKEIIQHKHGYPDCIDFDNSIVIVLLSYRSLIY